MTDTSNRVQWHEPNRILTRHQRKRIMKLPIAQMLYDRVFMSVHTATWDSVKAPERQPFVFVLHIPVLETEGLIDDVVRHKDAIFYTKYRSKSVRFVRRHDTSLLGTQFVRAHRLAYLSQPSLLALENETVKNMMAAFRGRARSLIIDLLLNHPRWSKEIEEQILTSKANEVIIPA